MNDDVKDAIMRSLIPDKTKEYACHVQYVAQIGIALAQEFNVDAELIEIACLLHDVGRDRELPGEDHADTSRRMAEEILSPFGFPAEKLEKIYASIVTHGSEEVPETIEQQIVRSADAGSKVEYHETFMLMCRKKTYAERLAWGMKYLEKGYSKICVESYQQRMEDKYNEIRTMYLNTLAMVQKYPASTQPE